MCSHISADAFSRCLDPVIQLQAGAPACTSFLSPVGGQASSCFSVVSCRSSLLLLVADVSVTVSLLSGPSLRSAPQATSLTSALRSIF